MAENLTPYSLSAPGFYGLNTQASPVDLDPKFALAANNCIIDQYGRVGSRKGWVKAHTANAQLGSSDIEAIGELTAVDGQRTILAAGGGYLFKLSGSTLTTLTYGGGGVAPTISANNWQMVSHNDTMMFFQIGHDTLIYDINLSTTQFRRLSEHPSYAGTAPQANCAISAWGRVWAARTTSDKHTIYWSDLLTTQVWTGGTAGSLDIASVWTLGGDEIVALGSHNNKLFIFGTRHIVIYDGADDPANMQLSDVIAGVGCIARDTVRETGSDIIFLSDSGLRSVMRTIQEKSAPLRTVSMNVNDDIKRFIADESNPDNIKSIYSETDAFYLLTFKTSRTTYCFDMRMPLDDGSSRTTVWYGINPRSYGYSKSRNLYIGKSGYIGIYSGYRDDTATYRLSYYSAWIDFGSPVALSIFKRMKMTLVGYGAKALVFKWAFDYSNNKTSYSKTLDIPIPVEYRIAEYGVSEYGGGYRGATEITIPGSGSGVVLQVGIESVINGNSLSIQRIDVFAKEGRI